MKVTNRNSTIGTQVNIENFFSSSVDSVSAWSDELEKLKPLIDKAKEDGNIDAEAAQEAKSSIDKANDSAKADNPNSQKITNYLNNAKNWVTGVGSLALALDKAIESIGKLF